MLVASAKHHWYSSSPAPFILKLSGICAASTLMAEVAQEVPGPAGSEVTRPNILFVMVGVIWCCLSLSGLYPSGCQQWVFHQAGSDFSHGGGKFLIKCSLKQWLMLYFSNMTIKMNKSPPEDYREAKHWRMVVGPVLYRRRKEEVFWRALALCFEKMFTCVLITNTIEHPLFSFNVSLWWFETN